MCSALLPLEAQGGAEGGNASLPLSRAAQNQQQHAEEQSCPSPGKGMQREAGRRAEDELRALQEQAASSEAELAESRYAGFMAGCPQHSPSPAPALSLGLPNLGLGPCLQGTGSVASDRAEPVAVETAGDP